MNLVRVELLLAQPERAEEHMRFVCDLLDGMPKVLQAEARLLHGETLAALGMQADASRELLAGAECLGQAPETRFTAHAWLTATGSWSGSTSPTGASTPTSGRWPASDCRSRGRGRLAPDRGTDRGVETAWSRR